MAAARQGCSLGKKCTRAVLSSTPGGVLMSARPQSIVTERGQARWWWLHLGALACLLRVGHRQHAQHAIAARDGERAAITREVAAVPARHGMIRK